MAICDNCSTSVQAGFLFCPTCGQAVSPYDDAIVCLNCNTANSAGTRFCKGCGFVLIKRKQTIKCAVCGSDNPQDAYFCTVCGSGMPGEKKLEFESQSVQSLKGIIPEIQAYSDASTPYAGMTESQIKEITYICPICGKVNDLTDEKCKRCGRDKKRTAQLIAKGRIPSFNDAVAVPDKLYKPFKSKKGVDFNAKSNIEDTGHYGKRSANTSSLYGSHGVGGGGGFGQMSPIVQPLAIVPYVSQEQPLWQVENADELDIYGAEKTQI